MSDSDDQLEKHQEFMDRRAEIARMMEESSTFVTDQWPIVLWGFFDKLTQGDQFSRQEALTLVSIWFNHTLSPKVEFPK